MGKRSQLVFIALILFIVGSVSVMAMEMDQEYQGWIIDKCCSGTKDPLSHTLMCLRMKSCAATGYGILVKQADGSLVFYKFDEAGHNLAVAYVNRTARQNDVTITVTGVWDGDVLKVSTLQEK